MGILDDAALYALCKKYSSQSKTYSDQAKEYRDQAFTQTPEGYSDFVLRVESALGDVTSISTDEDGNVVMTFTED